MAPEPSGKTGPYRRVLLKLSGEALMGQGGYGIDPQVVGAIADELSDVMELGIELALVVGGGNIFRGMSTSASGMDRASADYMGMLATVMNAMALQDALEQRNVMTRVQSAIEIREIAETYIRRRAMRHLEKRRVVIFAAGTGNPYFTTDTAAALRAMEIQADVLLKATKVDGIYDKDPTRHDDATRYEQVGYMECLQKDLKVMDMTAFALCRDNQLPIVVFDLTRSGNIKRVVAGEPVGTRVVSE